MKRLLLSLFLLAAIEGYSQPFIGAHVYNSVGTFMDNEVRIGGFLLQANTGYTFKIKKFRFDVALQGAYISDWRRPGSGFGEIGISILWRKYL